MQHFGIVETVLRDRYDFFGEIRLGVGIGHKIADMLMSSTLFLAIYGAVMGAAHSPVQAISSALKLPVLFLATLIICAPSLHFFNLLFGSKQTVGQTVALTLTAITTTSVLMLSFAPITLFFLLTTSQYDFFKLLNVAFFSVAGGLGVAFLRRGIIVTTMADNPDGIAARRLIFALWVLLYGFVGSQMAWTLSPFVGDPQQPFILFTQFGGNFYSDVLNSIGHLMGGM